MAEQRVGVPAIRVRQWLRAWDRIDFDERGHRRKPEPHFYLLSLDAGLLKRLTGVSRREVGQGERPDELGIQRRHDKLRSAEIAEFVQLGYPWSELPLKRRQSDDFRDLRKPGWLPTALVVNMLGPNDRRGGRRIRASEAIRVGPAANGVETLELPAGSLNSAWRPTDLAPLEIIDGQHRLWAFDEKGLPESFELPVVAFHALDISWQAYLFFTINIKPKRINRSLAFDLYPLLRTEEWLERFEGAGIYRETRAQEITEILWSHPASPWRARINMLGDPGRGGVTQAAWIRALLASFVKGWEGRGQRLGGLFGAPVGMHALALPWTRAQQAAFMVLLWDQMAAAIEATDAPWTRAVAPKGRGAMLAQHSLINTDPGVRVLLQVFNDLTYLTARDLRLFAWTDVSMTSEIIDLGQITEALASARNQPFAPFLLRVATAVAAFDWRTSAAAGLTEEERLTRMAFRGSGGYGELRRQLVRALVAGPDNELGAMASRVAKTLGMD